MRLVAPTVLLQKINRVNGLFPGVPAYLTNQLTNVSHIYNVTVTPAVADTKPGDVPRVTINAPANTDKRSGTLYIDNQGRVPKTAPAADQPDLRPIVYYMWGYGTQTLTIALNPSNWINHDIIIPP